MRYRFFVSLWHGISVFANFSYGIGVLDTPKCHPQKYVEGKYTRSRVPLARKYTDWTGSSQTMAQQVWNIKLDWSVSSSNPIIKAKLDTDSPCKQEIVSLLTY